MKYEILDKINSPEDLRVIPRSDMDKLSGGDNSSNLRNALAAYFSLPKGMTANALLEALNILTDLDGYRCALSKINAKNNT